MAKKSVKPDCCENNIEIFSKDVSFIAGERAGFIAGEAAAKRDLLLHSCCGPCSTSVIERLSPDYNITVFYYNPCITDVEEYEKRKENQIKFIKEYNRRSRGGISYLEGKYDPERYFEITEGYEREPEGGARCSLCFRMRLEMTAATAKKKGYSVFTTTLTVSPHKSYPVISEIGKEMARKFGIEFLDADFKKKAGFRRSVQLSKEYGLYRQDYCGCVYSKK